MRTASQIAKAWEEWGGQLGAFARMLDRRGVAYLSFSKVSSLEFCPQRYLLEYVERVKLQPEPKYFIKGRLFHDAAAKMYRGCMHGRRVSLDRIIKPVERLLSENDANHVRNALVVMQQQVDDDWQVVAAEEAFVLDLGKELPPCLGIVDLVLRRGDEYAVIDHKSGRQFSSPDRLQLVLYRQYACQQYGALRCVAYFDQYRWVNNLDRIRKPASHRTKIQVRNGTWNAVVRRLTARYREMQRIQKTGMARATGNCVTCPFLNQCPRASFEYGNDGW